MADEQTPSQAPEVLEAAPDELDQAFGGPAPYANKVYVTVSNFGVRLAFIETGSAGKDYFRTGVYLDAPDAENLKDLLNRAFEGLEPSNEPATEAKS